MKVVLPFKKHKNKFPPSTVSDIHLAGCDKICFCVSLRVFSWINHELCCPEVTVYIKFVLTNFSFHTQLPLSLFLTLWMFSSIFLFSLFREKNSHFNSVVCRKSCEVFAVFRRSNTKNFIKRHMLTLLLDFEAMRVIFNAGIYFLILLNIHLSIRTIETLRRPYYARYFWLVYFIIFLLTLILIVPSRKESISTSNFFAIFFFCYIPLSLYTTDTPIVTYHAHILMKPTPTLWHIGMR